MKQPKSTTANLAASLGFERLAFFSDAVFAIAITLLVIDLRLPPLEQLSDAGLLQALLQPFPQYIGFFVSFFVIGRFWIGHHQLFGLISGSDSTLVWRNLLFLLAIAFMPFPTALVGKFVQLRPGVCFYALWLAFAGWQNRRLIAYARGHLAAPGHEVELDAMLRNSWLAILIGMTAFAFGLVSPLLALVPLIASPLILRLGRLVLKT
jgi:uncharacterized membrane protein